MKRMFFTVLSFILVLTLTCCSDPVTSHFEKDLYQAGEIVRVYDNETNSRLADLTITNVRIIHNEPYTDSDYLCDYEDLTNEMETKYDGRLEKHGNKVYLNTEYKVIVQIDYIGNSLDTHNRINSSNFRIYDQSGNNADTDVDINYNIIPTNNDFMVVGLQEKGDVLVSFYFHNSQNEFCDIECKYDSETQSYIIVEDETDDTYCSSCNKLIDYDDNYCRYCGEKQK